RLLIVWWLVPTAIVSFGTSKLFHYAYPFLPPLALGAGFLIAKVIAMADPLARRVNWQSLEVRVLTRPMAAGFLLAVSIVCMALAFWVMLSGEPARLYWADTLVFRNSSVTRPIVIASALLMMSGYA